MVALLVYALFAAFSLSALAEELPIDPSFIPDATLPPSSSATTHIPLSDAPLAPTTLLRSSPPTSTPPAPLPITVSGVAPFLPAFLAPHFRTFMINTASASDKEEATPPKAQGFASLLSWRGTLMYSTTELQAIYSAFETSQSRIMSTLNTAAGSATVSTTTTSLQAPRFYLNSLLYISPKRWSIWVNNKKLFYPPAASPPSPDEKQLEVVSISASNVKLQWKTTLLDSFAPYWQENFLEDAQGNFISPDFDIVVNKEKNAIQFTLYPNQSFIVERMEIIEGMSISQ